MAKEIKKTPGIKPEDTELKKLLEQKERQGLIFGADALLPEQTIDKELEIYHLQNGTPFTIKGIKDLIDESANDYFPMFPNRKPFFKLMYKLCGWTNLDPNNFIKPSCVALWIKQYIYARFPAEILPTLLDKQNPIIAGYIKKYKLFQFLNEQGIILLEKYIQEAIDVMETSTDWYDFELKYTALYKLSVQLKMFQ